MNNFPITVLMPVYNTSPFLKEAIESILSQTYENFEFLIINDGSTDSSPEIIKSFTDHRIRYINNETNLGLIKTLNKGIELSKSDFIVRMDSDDVSFPTRLEKQYTYMLEHPEIGICGTGFQVISAKSKIEVKYNSGHDEIKFRQLYQIHLCHGSSIIRKTIFDKVNNIFDENYSHAEDYEFFTRASSFIALGNIQEVLYAVRDHDTNISKKENKTQRKNTIRISLREFQKLGFEIDEQQLNIFKSLMHQSYSDLEQYFDDVQYILENMIRANEKTNYFNANFFTKRIAYLWFHFCFNTKHSKKYSSSILSTLVSLTIIERYKIKFKSKFELF